MARLALVLSLSTLTAAFATRVRLSLCYETMLCFNSSPTQRCGRVLQLGFQAAPAWGMTSRRRLGALKMQATGQGETVEKLRFLTPEVRLTALVSYPNPA